MRSHAHPDGCFSPRFVLVALGPLSLCVAFFPAVAGVLNVPSEYPTIQSAIEAASVGDTVLVDPGNYDEAIDFVGKPILVGSQYVVTGDTSFVHETVIDASDVGNASVASFTSGENRTSRLSGFTLTGGSRDTGAGVYCEGTSPTLDRVRIVANTAQGHGGGIYAFQGDPLVGECWIAGNTATQGDGGGIWAGFSEIVIDASVIHDNVCGQRGAGIFCEKSAPLITDNRITGNRVEGPNAYNGGGITSRDCVPVITGNFIADNDGHDYGGGLFY